MKSVGEMEFPDKFLYFKDHQWVINYDDFVRIGISDYAQDRLGEIVYIDLPQKGESLTKGEVFGTVESVKAVSELYMPVSGDIININPDLENAPKLINSDPYDDGWMIEVRPADRSQLGELMSRKIYMHMLENDE